MWLSGQIYIGKVGCCSGQSSEVVHWGVPDNADPGAAFAMCKLAINYWVKLKGFNTALASTSLLAVF